mgnify:CR=1 FL=1
MRQTGLPLEGLKVVEMCWLFAGPIVCKMLADHGAEVIKMESPHKPDDVRAYGPYKDNIPGMNRGPIFANYNGSKLGITCDLKNPRGLAMAVALGSSLGFLTPVGHPVNTLVMGPGGYASRDFFRVGGLLLLILVPLILAGLHLFWNL